MNITLTHTCLYNSKPSTTFSRAGTATFGTGTTHIIFRTIFSCAECSLALIRCQPVTILHIPIVKPERKAAIILTQLRAQVATQGTSGSHIIFAAIFFNTGACGTSICRQPTAKLVLTIVKDECEAGVVLAGWSWGWIRNADTAT
jgi:hypothetical protein